MGININAGFAELIMRFHSYKDFKGKTCLMLGVQHVGEKGIDIIRVAQSVDFELIPEIHMISNKERFREIDSYTLFKWLGFSEVLAMDVSDYEGADIVQNLNQPIGEDLFDRFDLIYDGGTLEHVFDTKQAMDNLTKMVRIGGWILHDLPAANQCNHGFYTFSPTLFTDFYKSNGFRIDTIHLFNRYQNTDENIQYNSVDCRLYDPWTFLTTKLDVKKECSFIVCMVTKEKSYNTCKSPIQGMYLDMYSPVSNLYDDAIKYAVKFIKKRKYQRIGIYGMGINAVKLYDYLKREDIFESIYLIRGYGDEKKDISTEEYKIKDLKNIKIDCLVIGSIKYADIIEERIKNNTFDSEIDLINILDI